MLLAFAAPASASGNTFSISGQVIDANGNPLQGADVTLIDFNSKAIEEKQTAEHGNFDFVNVVSDTDTVTVKVSFTRDGKTYVMPQYFARWYPARGLQVIPSRETMIPDYPEPVYGYVYGAIQSGSGASFINGVVYLVCQDGVRYYEFADRTDGKGSYSFYVPSGNYTLYAQHWENGVCYESTHMPITIGRNVDMTDPNLVPTPIIIPLNNPTSNPDPAEAPAHYANKVSGTVMTKDGKPFAGATVALLKESDNGTSYIQVNGSGPGPLTTVTDSNGYYQFDGISPTTDNGKSVQAKKNIKAMVEYKDSSGVGQTAYSEPAPLYYPDMIMGYGKEYSARNVTLQVTLPIAQAGWVNLTSVPSGASIFVDEQQLYGPDGKPLVTPSMAYLDAGHHEIKMSMEGYQDKVATVAVMANKETEFAPMELQKALVSQWVTPTIVPLLAALIVGIVCLAGLYVFLSRKGN